MEQALLTNIFMSIIIGLLVICILTLFNILDEIKKNNP